MENKYVRVMDGDISNASGIKFKIGEVNVCSNWNPLSENIDDTGGINFSNEENILRWIRRGDTIYDVELPIDAEIVKINGTFTPNGLFRTNKIIVKNPRKLTEDVVLDLYRKSNMPEVTYYTVLAILAQKSYDKVAMLLLKERVNKSNVSDVLEYYKNYCDEHDDVYENPGLYYKYLDILEEIESNLDISVTLDKDPYIRNITNDKVINLIGQNGSGKTFYSKTNFLTDDYLIIELDDIFNGSVLNKELSIYLKNKYNEIPDLGDNFDLIYKGILDCYSKYDKTIVILSSKFHCIKDPTILKGKVIILRTCVDTCYERCINKYIENTDKEDLELDRFKRRMLKMYNWYKPINQFIYDLDLFLNNKDKHLEEIRKLNNNKDFTLLTNNCLAGYIYHDLGLKFLSPTINLRIKPKHFFEFIKDIHYYINNEVVEVKDSSEDYPVGIIYGDSNHSDINIFFQHYRTFDEAKSKWDERKRRINFDNLYVMWEFYDGVHSEELLEIFSNINIEKKLVLTHKYHNLECSYPIDIFNETLEMSEIGGKIFKYEGLSGKRYYERFDYINFLNNK